jgi:hypothetical protein
LFVRSTLWVLGMVPFVALWNKSLGVVGIIIAGSFVCSAVWTGVQWFQGRRFPNLDTTEKR